MAPIVRPTTASIGRQIGCEGATAGSAGERRQSVAGPQSHDFRLVAPGRGSLERRTPPEPQPGAFYMCGETSRVSSQVLRSHLLSLCGRCVIDLVGSYEHEGDHGPGGRDERGDEERA